MNTAQMTPLTDRFMAQVVKDDSGCWLWSGRHDKDGYATWDLRNFQGTGKRETRVARISLALFADGVPDGLQPDHLCRNRGCVNPDHLEPVTPRENTLRGEGVAAKNARKTRCKRGHKLSGENLGRHTNGGRYCRICNGGRRSQ